MGSHVAETKQDCQTLNLEAAILSVGKLLRSEGQFYKCILTESVLTQLTCKNITYCNFFKLLSLTQYFRQLKMFNKKQLRGLNFLLLISTYRYTFEKIVHWKTTKGKLIHLAPNVDLTALVIKWFHLKCLLIYGILLLCLQQFSVLKWINNDWKMYCAVRSVVQGQDKIYFD